MGETFLSPCPPPHLQFCEMDTDELTPPGQHPALHSSSPCAPDVTHHCFGCGQLCSSSALLIVAVISLIFLRSYRTTSPQDLPTDSHPFFSVFQLLFFQSSCQSSRCGILANECKAKDTLYFSFWPSCVTFCSFSRSGCECGSPAAIRHTHTHSCSLSAH